MSKFKIDQGLPITPIERLGEDLTGQRFGRLLVIKRVNRHGNAWWRCKCDCGREKNVRAASLLSGNTGSCGCLSAELPRERRLASVPNIIGHRFGRLIVLSQDGCRCEVRCDCDGKVKIIPDHRLVSGEIDSCGCLEQERLEERQRAKVMQHRKQRAGP
jgi:hypothetical protein